MADSDIIVSLHLVIPFISMDEAIEGTNTERKSAEIEISSKNPQIFFPFFHEKRREKPRENFVRKFSQNDQK
jgi:hypothetical protein